jgi:hypothetical protein
MSAFDPRWTVIRTRHGRCLASSHGWRPKARVRLDQAFDDIYILFACQLRVKAEPTGGTMRSRRSFLHLGLVTATTLSVSSASAAPAYFGSPRGGGTVTARDDSARTFTAARRRRAWTYHVTDKTRFVVDGAQGSWWDVRIGTVVQVRWHRAGNQRVADIVGIRVRRN